MITQNSKAFFKENRKVMFIEPPFYRLYHDQYCLVKYPLALGYLSGAVMKNTDWSVQTYNADFNVEKKVFNPENDYVAGEGFRGFSIGVIANDSEIEVKGSEIEGINNTNTSINFAKDDIYGHKEVKDFNFPSFFIEYTAGDVISWTVGAEHIPGTHSFTKKSRTDSADANTTGNDSDHGDNTANAELSDLTTLYFEPGLQFNDYIFFDIKPTNVSDSDISKRFTYNYTDANKVLDGLKEFYKVILIK